MEMSVSYFSPILLYYSRTIKDFLHCEIIFITIKHIYHSHSVKNLIESRKGYEAFTII